MKAIICEKLGQQLSIKNIESPRISENELLVAVDFASINFPDKLMIEGKYQFMPNLPFVVGGELSGVVIEKGKNIKKIQIGQKVLANVRNGAFAEYVATQEFRTFPISEKVHQSKAAAMPTNYGTAYYALLQRANLQKGEYVAITGAGGGLGTAAIQVAKYMGAKVLAITSSREKMDFCLKNGADKTILLHDNLREEIKDFTSGKGLDVVFDTTGWESEKLLRNLRRNGRFLVVGFASGSIPKIPLNLVLLKTIQIIGVFWTDFVLNFAEESQKQLQEMVKCLENDWINPQISKIFDFWEVEQAFDFFDEKQHLGKVLLDFSQKK